MAKLSDRIIYKGHSIIPVYFEESNSQPQSGENSQQSCSKVVFDLYMGITYTRYIDTWNSVKECKEYVDRPTRF